MGILRKAISGSAAIVTGGASLAVVQFRSDTERGTRETKKLRKQIHSSDVVGTSIPNVLSGHQTLGAGSTDALGLVSESKSTDAPSDTSAGWKADPSTSATERFWSGSAWTDITRTRQQ